MIAPFTIGRVCDLLGGQLLPGADPDTLIEGVVSSSRHDHKRSIFVAYKGVKVDGHDFIPAAFDNGSVAAVVTDADRLEGRAGILVKDSQRALSQLCAAFAGDPSRDLLTIGITGTNGKTTVHWLLYHALDRLGWPGIRIGSLGISAHGLVEHSGKVTGSSGLILMTTPGPQEIHQSLRETLDRGLMSCVLETSSHALDQHRVADVNYDAAIFTNLSQDHLNYHHDMEQYFKTKVKLFEQLAAMKKKATEKGGGAAINTDCAWGKRLVVIAEGLGLPIITFGSDDEASVRILRFEQGFPRGTLTLEHEGEELTITTPLVGDYNASNIAAAFAGLLNLGFEPKETATALQDILSVPGRLESVGNEDITVLIDYAHTGEGLRNLLSALKTFTKHDLWVLFGCGGGKDPGKRKAMGEAAMEWADKIVLTADNPRNEDPARIIEDILLSGCQPEIIELDRGLAIEETLRRARKGDVVVLAGKGHEDYQIIAGVTHHFSDRDEAVKWREQGLLERPKEKE